MANLLLRILAVVALLIGLALLIGTLLPRDYEVQASIHIAAPAGRVFPHINRLAAWPAWSNWSSQRIPELALQYHGPEAGEGAVQTWTEPRGSGKLWIVRSQPDTVVEYHSKFAGFPLMVSSIELHADGGETDVFWRSSGSLPAGPFYGWFGRSVFSGALQHQYESSLARLKTLMEAQAPPPDGAGPPGEVRTEPRSRD